LHASRLSFGRTNLSLLYLYHIQCYLHKVIEVIHPDPYSEGVDPEGMPLDPADPVDPTSLSPHNMVQDPIEHKPGTMNPFITEEDFQLSMVQREPDNGTNNQLAIDQETMKIAAEESANQRDLLIWHCRLGHLSMKKLQRLASMGMLPSKLAKCRIPMCQSCMYGMLTRQAWRTKTPPSSIAPTVTKPGQHVSVDQMESPVPGLIGQLKGKPTLARYRFATVFVETFSRSGYIHLQQTSNADETLEAKKQFESYAKSHNVTINHYHADNGRFIEKAWQQHATLMGQTLSYAGVGAHHQNGIVGKRIRDLQDLARSSLIHAIRRWPDAVNTHLWPYALRKANNSYNLSLPINQETTPIELFAGSNVAPNLKYEHPFGCPAYVLEKSMQTGFKAPKWGSRARLGIYLGNSEYYAASVSLVLSLSTGLVSPQYHVKHDDQFITVSPSMGAEIPKSEWQNKCHFVGQQLIQNKRYRSLADVPITDHQSIQQQENKVPEAELTPSVTDDPIVQEPTPEEPNVQVQVEPPFQVQPNVPVVQQADPPIMTRSGRITGPPSRLQDYVVYEATVDVERVTPMIDTMSPLTFAASSDPDTLYFHEAMKAHDREQFINAMKDEIEGQTKNGNWVVIEKSKIPQNARVLPAVWAMRRKRRVLDGAIYKWKSRLNVDGGKQIQGLDYWETYAPVTSWGTIRTILVLSIINQWEIMQLDFVQAYPQAPIQAEMYMALPKGFLVEGSREHHVLKLVRNIYGQKQAGRVWNEFLINGLKELGFAQSSYDMCLLWRGSCLLVIYTDDTIVTGPDLQSFKTAISDIAGKFTITTTEGLADFLGVNIKVELQGKKITFSQPQLIRSIIRDLGLDHDGCKAQPSPCVANSLMHEFVDSPPHTEPWSYRSVIGKLNYLEKSSRPDISYAVHQCARFCSNPKVEHSAAVKRIGRYLLSSMDRGIICQPNDESLTCYSDASFLGEWNKGQTPDNPVSARSRTGYILMYAGCPIIWCSKLQTEIAHSATEAEYIALSQALKEVTSMMYLLEELKAANFELNVAIPKVHCKLHEDNAGAIEMARLPKMRPRTKHLNAKYHHFREAVRMGKIEIVYIKSKAQLADLLTKALIIMLFEALRSKIQGW
jgi:Reverse transcriptase (RNA-dependent DNA polymerase)/GAG-pre-integrase domain